MVQEAFYGEVTMKDGRPRLYINGKEKAPLMFALSDITPSRAWTAQAQRNIKNFADQGIDIVQVDTCLYLGWEKGKKLDIGFALKELDGAISISPEAKIMIRLHVNAPYWWMQENPEELTVYAEADAKDDGGKDYEAWLIRHDVENRK
jgi:hypothetical protein